MTSVSEIRKTVEEWLEGKDYFLVDAEITPDDRIIVEIDHAEGVWIDDCASLSRYVQDKLGEAIDEYDLEVGSAGIGQPFKVARQYINHIGKNVEVMTEDGTIVRGVLSAVDGDTFTVLAKEKRQVEGKKRPVKVDVEKVFDMNKIKYTKYLLSFK